MFVIAGLGNPGDEYAGSRHNVGRTLVQKFAEKEAKKGRFEVWKEDKKARALVSEDMRGKEKVLLILPNTFMNRSGNAVMSFVKSKKAALQLVVVYDDIDLPLGIVRIAFGRSSGGHRGLESIIKSIKTKDFVRIRVGVSPATSKGKVKKPVGEKKVIDFLMGSFRKPEEEKLKKVAQQVGDIIEALIAEGRVHAMNRFN